MKHILRYLRISVFYKVMSPFSAWSRARRMRRFVSLFHLESGMSVLDLGGTPGIWEGVSTQLAVTILNLTFDDMDPGRRSSHHSIRYIVGDACDVSGLSDRSFDLIFSNSVVEHVGAADKRQDFAREVRRLGKAYWVQTPSKWFPIEAHSGMPFWWLYPGRLRASLIERWRKKLPGWTQMIEGTCVVSKAELRRLFPEATILVERVLGIPKSYVAYYTGPARW